MDLCASVARVGNRDSSCGFAVTEGRPILTVQRYPSSALLRKLDAESKLGSNGRSAAIRRGRLVGTPLRALRARAGTPVTSYRVRTPEGRCVRGCWQVVPQPPRRDGCSRYQVYRCSRHRDTSEALMRHKTKHGRIPPAPPATVFVRRKARWIAHYAPSVRGRYLRRRSITLSFGSVMNNGTDAPILADDCETAQAMRSVNSGAR